MKWRELLLRGKQVLRFPDGTGARLDWYSGYADQRFLRVVFESGKKLELPDAVDISQTFDDPRVITIEGRRPDHVLLIGGEQAHCINSQGAIEHSFRLFRKEDLSEYWTTTLIDRGNVLLVVYESGVLIVDELLRVRFHKKKLINDILNEVEENSLKFVRDHDTVWYMSLVMDSASS